MRTLLPLALAALLVLLMAITFFSEGANNFYGTRVNTGLFIFMAFAAIPAAVSLVRLHATRIQRRHPTAIYSVITVLAFAVTVVLGFIDRRFGGPMFMWIYRNTFVPLQQTVFAFLAFFIASAAYRAFRVRTLEATILLISAVVVLLGNAVVSLPGPTGSLEGWLLGVPSMSMQRGIILGVALGTIAQSVRILLGLERGFVGRD